MQNLIRTAILVCAALTLCTTHARAASIGPDCATCQGSIYTLDITKAPTELIGSDGVDTYLVTLSIDTSGYNGGGVRIDDVAVKISSGVDKATLTSMTTTDGGTNYANYWTQVAGGINAGGCSGSGSGYDCTEWKVNSAGLGAAYVPTGSTLTWQFLIDVSGTVFDPLSLNPDLLPSIKVQYVDASGNKVGALVSEKVPEPSTLALLGMGAAVAVIRRRRTQR